MSVEVANSLIPNLGSPELCIPKVYSKSALPSAHSSEEVMVVAGNVVVSDTVVTVVSAGEVVEAVVAAAVLDTVVTGKDVVAAGAEAVVEMACVVWVVAGVVGISASIR